MIFRPMAPSSDSCLINSDLTLVSLLGGGVSKARAVVTMGPSCVHRTIVSPACKQPLTKMTSSVAPRPSTTCAEHFRQAQIRKRDHPRHREMDTSHINKVKAPRHFKTPRADLDLEDRALEVVPEHELCSESLLRQR